MTPELIWLTVALLLAFAQIMIAAAAKRRQDGMAWAAGPRDNPPTYTGMAARLQRAQSNLFETLPLFAAAVLIAHIAGREGALTLWGVRLFVIGRVLYVPLYAWGVPYIRSLAFFVATAGMGLVFIAIL